MNKGADAAQGDHKREDGKVAGRFMLKLSGEAFAGGGVSVSTPTSYTPSPGKSRRSSAAARKSRSSSAAATSSAAPSSSSAAWTGPGPTTWACSARS